MDGDTPVADPFNLPPEAVTTGQLYMAMQQLNTRIALQNGKLEEVRKEVREHRADTRDLVAAWKAGGTLLALVKLLGVVATALLASYGAFKLAIKLWWST